MAHLTQTACRPLWTETDFTEEGPCTNVHGAVAFCLHFKWRRADCSGMASLVQEPFCRSALKILLIYVCAYIHGMSYLVIRSRREVLCRWLIWSGSGICGLPYNLPCSTLLQHLFFQAQPQHSNGDVWETSWTWLNAFYEGAENRLLQQQNCIKNGRCLNSKWRFCLQ